MAGKEEGSTNNTGERFHIYIGSNVMEMFTNVEYTIQAHRYRVQQGNIQLDEGPEPSRPTNYRRVMFGKLKSTGERAVFQNVPQDGASLGIRSSPRIHREEKVGHKNMSLELDGRIVDTHEQATYIKVTDDNGNGHAFKIMSIIMSGESKSLSKKKRTKKRTKKRRRRKRKHRKKSQNRKNRKKK